MEHGTFRYNEIRVILIKKENLVKVSVIIVLTHGLVPLFFSIRNLLQFMITEVLYNKIKSSYHVFCIY